MPLGYKPNTVRESFIAALEALRHPKAKRGKKLKLRHSEAREQSANHRAHRAGRGKAKEQRGNAEAEVGYEREYDRR
jgi:hypothetical protein